MGGLAGRLLAQHLSSRKTALSRIFAVTVSLVGAYVIWRGYRWRVFEVAFDVFDRTVVSQCT